MKFTGKVIDANKTFNSLMDSEIEGELIFIKNKEYALRFNDKKYIFEIYRFVFGANSIELEGWAGSKDNNFGRLALRIEPVIAK